MDGKEFSQPLEVEIDPNVGKDVVALSVPEFDEEEDESPKPRVDD